MPPKVKISKEDIIKTAIKLVREEGPDSLNARAIATMLNCSTQPIFSNFTTMGELEKEVITYAYGVYTDFLKREVESNKYPKYKAFGMAYVRFAKDEKELFKLLFMRDRSDEDTSPSVDFEEAVQMMMEINDISYEKATLMHLEIWFCVHGIGTMLATSFLSLDWELISDMISDVYKGLVQRHKSEDFKNECN